MKKYKNILITILFIIFTIVIISWTIEEPEKEEKLKKEETIEKPKKEKQETNEKIKVDLKGEINNPGVYELTNQNNVIDAINMAGGLTNKSDTSNINLSKKLTDEMVIIVYSKAEINEMKNKDKIVCPPCNNACVETKDEKAKINITETKENKTETKEMININTANLEELQKLEGIGKAKAEAIIEYRNKNGNFKQIEEIKNVSGIGETAFEKIKNNITV